MRKTVDESFENSGGENVETSNPLARASAGTAAGIIVPTPETENADVSTCGAWGDVVRDAMM